MFLYGRQFTLLTDHKPLVSILNPRKEIPPLAAARMQRWAWQLSAYQYSIQFRPTKAHANIDCLSRLPVNAAVPAVQSASSEFNIAQVEALPVTAVELVKATQTLMSKVFLHVWNGSWPCSVEDSLRPYYQRREQLTLEGNRIRVVIQWKLRSKILDELHQGHPGVTHMKSLARGFVWWPGLDNDLEELSRNCDSCQLCRK